MQGHSCSFVQPQLRMTKERRRKQHGYEEQTAWLDDWTGACRGAFSTGSCCCCCRLSIPAEKFGQFRNSHSIPKRIRSVGRWYVDVAACGLTRTLGIPGTGITSLADHPRRRRLHLRTRTRRTLRVRIPTLRGELLFGGRATHGSPEHQAVSPRLAIPLYPSSRGHRCIMHRKSLWCRVRKGGNRYPSSVPPWWWMRILRELDACSTLPRW